MKTVAFTACIFLSIAARSQTVSSHVINASGSHFSQGYYNIDWSIGELSLVGSLVSDGQVLILTNGFLQPDVADGDRGNVHRYFTADEITIFPNPTHGKIEVNFSTRQKGTLQIIIYDATGKSVQATQLLSNGIKMSKTIDLTAVAAGTYFMKIELVPTADAVRKTGTYKIIKL